MVPFAILAALSLGDAGAAPAATVGRSERPVEKTYTVGQIFIIGHEDVVTSFILDHLDIRPGDVVTYQSLRQAERRLADLGVFVVDPVHGQGPTITPQETGRVANLWVRVVEQAKAVR
ncbi:MAG TPA: POTRA domain-containing protein [Gemmataceae bacterium]|nr:POTRA domain-containing protein [Gemmataceae bacterium]